MALDRLSCTEVVLSSQELAPCSTFLDLLFSDPASQLTHHHAPPSSRAFDLGRAMA